MEPGTALRDRNIDRQHAAIERWQDVTIQPRPKDRTLRWIPALGQQYAHLQLLNRDRRQEQIGGIDAISPYCNVSIRFAQPNLPEFRDDIGIE